ncbi:hypothetical protein BH20ACT11_BH20ACT11_04960 [soil metagenome]
MSKKVDGVYSNSGVSPNSGISREDVSKSAVSVAVKVAGLAKEEARYAIPAARKAASHAVKEFGRKFAEVYERQQKEK